MADWYGTCRSNYFRVKDFDAFKAMLEAYEAKLIKNTDGLVGFISEDFFGSIPSRYIDGDEDEGIDEENLSILDEIAEHLADNQVCIVMEAGAEKARFITGQAIAIAWNGETTRISLSDIYKEAQEAFGDEAQITEAIY